MTKAADGPFTTASPEGDPLQTADITPLPNSTVKLDCSASANAAYAFLDSLSTGPRYTRSSLHASGGMGHVWRAEDVTLGREVVVKELRSDIPNGPGSLRFIREARITGRLEHPGVVPVYELGRDPTSGQPFYVMRYIRGRTLSQVVAVFHRQRRVLGRYDSVELVGLLTAFVSICNTIAYAHSHGIIHRDLKGENVILGEFGEVIVLDWGLAKRMDDDEEDTTGSDPIAEQDPSRTVMGQVIGTLAYMSPEQAEGRTDLIGPGTDIFGLGALLYEILTGHPPFEGSNVTTVLHLARRSEIVPPHDIWSAVPPGLEAICLKAMSRLRADRHFSALELGQEVQGWQDQQRRQAEDELRRAFERLHCQQAALVELTRTEVFAGSDLAAIFRQLVETAARTLGVERVSIWRFTPDRRAIRSHALYELTPNRHSAGTELTADMYPNYFAALSETDVIAADDAQRDPRTSEFTAGYLAPLGIVAMMEVPIHPDGVLCHEHIGPPRKWTPDEQLFAIAVGHLAAHAISHWERRQALEQLRQADRMNG